MNGRSLPVKNGYVIEKNLGYNELYIIKMGKSFGEVEEMNANSNSTYTKKEPELNEEEVVALLQKRLNEIGCNAGPVDGKFGRRTENAIIRFTKKAGLNYSNLSNLTEEFFD